MTVPELELGCSKCYPSLSIVSSRNNVSLSGNSALVYYQLSLDLILDIISVVTTLTVMIQVAMIQNSGKTSASLGRGLIHALSQCLQSKTVGVKS